MADPTSTQSAAARVIALPTAAADPVINPKRRGRLPADISTLPGWRRMKVVEVVAAKERHASQIHEGLLVRVCQRTSRNYGRVARVVSAGTDRQLCVLTPIGGGFIDWDGALTDFLCVKVADVEPQAQAAMRAALRSPSEPGIRSRTSRATDGVTK